MATLHPSPSPSPGPGGNANTRSPNLRASMGPSARPSVGSQGLSPASPRPGGVSGAGRPTSELLGGAGMFQTPEAEAIDQWFETFQNYEVTLEEMAAASLDVNFKEELSAIEQWFKVLSEAERTAALYSLLQHSTQVQIRFFITVLQQMARSDPMTALLSPAVGSSMQSQMEAKLASMNLKSPGVKSGFPASPTARNFSGSRASMGESNSNGFLSPDAANVSSGGGHDPAATLAQQRAKLKAGNPMYRISAPALGTTLDSRGWGSPSSQLAQVDERSSSPAQEITIPAPSSTSRPKSTDFSGVANAFKSPKLDDTLSPMVGDSWASMVNTPLMPMFSKNNRDAGQSLDAAAVKLNDWTANGGGVPLISDPPKRMNRLSKGNSNNNSSENNTYNEDGNGMNQGNNQQHGQRSNNGGLRNASGAGNGNAFGGQGGWNGVRSPALSNTSGRLSDEGNNLNGLGMAGFGMGMGSPGLGMGLPGAGGLGMFAPGMPMSPFGNMFNMNSAAAMSNLAAMGVSPEQLLAMQIATGQLGQPGLNPFGLGLAQASPSSRSGRGLGSARSPGKSPSVRDAKKDEEEVDPKLLDDVPGWLRSLRLHKYTPNFEGMHWKDMVMMDEAALEAKGVAALGARRKMLKTFEVVRKKMGIDTSASTSPTSLAAAA
ncbi:uncharacterized protein LAESUDRAFT_669881 [Laetiporus sulphureus 93-53]|uniref:RNA-binding protein VTS1 n=1 Tax=Laetiporus sulphureus 93-53 TaxID=1314785 RepID=A0A165HIW1_9APHY|nr:uncharacterized protein LAESUDRAFT_669881 [Laetiporus sulphureus 93-53]KZT11785.1 hypothetical protein LAESUDRAFT_669881 [Laetiporus sulphureus 93-53]